MKKKLYIACALTYLPLDKKEEFLQMISKIKKELGKHFEILEFLGIDDLRTDKPFTPQEIYNYDIKKCVMKADCILAIVDYPALGVGYEMGTAIEKRGIPVLAMAHKDHTVGRVIRGIDHPNFHFMNYNSVDEIIEKTLEILG
jgi:nucleoside 2-deoxyribosyltransferase